MKEPRAQTFAQNRKWETNDFYVEFCAKRWRKTPQAGQTSDFRSLDGQIQDDFHCFELPVSQYYLSKLAWC